MHAERNNEETDRTHTEMKKWIDREREKGIDE